MADFTDGQLIGLMTLGIGVIAFLAVLEWRRRFLRLRRNGVTTVAEVISSDHRVGENSSWYRTRISLRDLEGEDVSAKLNLTRSHNAGDKLRVVYDPEKPTRVSLASSLDDWNPDGGLLAFGRRWGLVLIFVIPGVLMLLIPFCDPICDDPAFRDMQFCETDRP